MGTAFKVEFCFNPTLVRLRPGIRAVEAFAHQMFQSHAGSIEAHDAAGRDAYAGDVSIPRWFD